jgi:7-cyano-7-deazaguanine synthase
MHNDIVTSVLVVLSGGQDSATCLFWAKKHYAHVHAVTFDYGQKHRVELDCAKRLADLAPVESYEVIDIRGTMPQSALTDNSISVMAKHSVNPSLPATFTAGRNAIFLSIAAGRAYSLGCASLVTGVCQTDYSGYPDCRDEFIKAMSSALSAGLGTELSILTPLMHKTKAETWSMARELGVLDIVVNLTHTCYNGNHTKINAWGYGCGECPACVIRARGFREASL